jgi:hypothetical protein
MKRSLNAYIIYPTSHFNVMFIAKMCKAFLETAMVIPIVQHNSYKLQNYALA